MADEVANWRGWIEVIEHMILMQEYRGVLDELRVMAQDVTDQHRITAGQVGVLKQMQEQMRSGCS